MEKPTLEQSWRRIPKPVRYIGLIFLAITFLMFILPPWSLAKELWKEMTVLGGATVSEWKLFTSIPISKWFHWIPYVLTHYSSIRAKLIRDVFVVSPLLMYWIYFTRGWKYYKSIKKEFLKYFKLDNTRKRKPYKNKKIPIEDVTIKTIKDYRDIFKRESGMLAFLLVDKLFVIVFDKKGYKKFYKYRPYEDSPYTYPSVYYGNEEQLELCTKNESIMNVHKLLKGVE